MCDVGKAFSRAFTPPGTGGAEAALEQSRADANKALLAQEQAKRQIETATDGSNETVRLASEARLRKILAAGPFGAVLPPPAAATVATRQLYGG